MDAYDCFVSICIACNKTFEDFWDMKPSDVFVQELDLMQYDTHEQIAKDVIKQFGHVRRKCSSFL